MTTENDTVFDTIRDLILEVSTVKPELITAEARLREDLALDSVASMELLSMLDESLGLELEMEDVLGIETVGGVVALAKSRMGGATA
ncbi:MAG: acyl carrier protein [Deltaproteobacteria bacterium]|nr:MAG: acyl carrier protein [Deltaproteobacteria bacterium]